MKEEITVLPLGDLLHDSLLRCCRFVPGYTQPLWVRQAMISFFSYEFEMGQLRFPDAHTFSDVRSFTLFVIRRLEEQRFDLKSNADKLNLIATAIHEVASSRDTPAFWKLLAVHCFTRGFDATVPTEQLVIPQQVVPLVALPA